MKLEIALYRRILKAELESRMERNPRYSIRAFAQALGLQPSALAQILAGKRQISTRVIERLLSRLELSERERAAFVRSVLDEKTSRGVSKINRRLQVAAAEAKPSRKNTAPARELGLDQFRIISDWYHYAILEMTYKKDFKLDPRWIASRLGITTTEAKLAIERLQQMELLGEDDEGRSVKTGVTLATKDRTKTSAFHRRRQKQIIEKSLASLENDPIEERSHTALTVCIDPAQLPEAKERIQSFLWELSALLEKGTPRRVYELGVQLFPLEKALPPEKAAKPEPKNPETPRPDAEKILEAQ